MHAITIQRAPQHESKKDMINANIQIIAIKRNNAKYPFKLFRLMNACINLQNCVLVSFFIRFPLFPKEYFILLYDRYNIMSITSVLQKYRQQMTFSIYDEAPEEVYLWRRR